MEINFLFEGGEPPIKDIPEDSIAVVVGENIPKVHLASVGIVPEVNFYNFVNHLHHRAIMVCPEGFTKILEGGSIISNHPSQLFINCSNLVKYGFKGFVLTNNHIVVETIYLQGLESKREVIFYVMKEDKLYRVPTIEMCAVYQELNKVFADISQLQTSVINLLKKETD